MMLPPPPIITHPQGSLFLRLMRDLQRRQDEFFGRVVTTAMMRAAARHYGLTFNEVVTALEDLPDWSAFVSASGWERFGEHVAAVFGVADDIPAIKITLH
jgi:hypothetical protein